MTAAAADLEAVARVADDRPDVAVVVATFRRPDLLARCLAALCAQTLDGRRYEIVVADDDAGNPGAARTQVLVAQYLASTHGAPGVRYLPVTRTQGPAGARNAGWRATDAHVIAFTDDDTIPERDWLETALDYLASGFDAAGGAIEMPLPASPTDYERDAAGLSRAEFATANCFVVREALVHVGGFDERFTSAWREDSDLHFALLGAGYRVGRSDASRVVHPIRPARFGVSLPQQRKSIFEALLYKKHPELYRERIGASAPWNYYGSVAALIAAAGATVAGAPTIAVASIAVWVVLTARFAWRRLRGTSRSLRHVTEMLWTSVAIPPLSVWWRLVGALRYRVVFL